MIYAISEDEMVDSSRTPFNRASRSRRRLDTGQLAKISERVARAEDLENSDDSKSKTLDDSSSDSD